jgi:hypothetical protein
MEGNSVGAGNGGLTGGGVGVGVGVGFGGFGEAFGVFCLYPLTGATAEGEKAWVVFVIPPHV